MTPLATLRIFTAGCLLGACVAVQAAPQLGGQPPVDLGVDQQGDAVRVSDFAGKALVITFWATWCPYCLKELPVLHNIQNKVGKDRLQVIAVNTEEHEVFRRATRVLAKLNVLHTRDLDRASQNAYGVKGLPHMVIVGRDGKITAIHTGYGEGALTQIAADINRALAAAN